MADETFPYVETRCTCLYSPGDEGYWEDPDCPTHGAA